MGNDEPRRSARLSTQDSNRRDYLAETIGWTRSQFDAWLALPSVRPHMCLWYQLCVVGEHRFNDAVEWINTGPKGYFYNEGDLEEDLLLMCLCEGTVSQESYYGDETAKTGRWITQEIWARTAWRIVKSNGRDS